MPFPTRSFTSYMRYNGLVSMFFSHGKVNRQTESKHLPPNPPKNRHKEIEKYTNMDIMDQRADCNQIKWAGIRAGDGGCNQKYVSVKRTPLFFILIYTTTHIYDK